MKIVTFFTTDGALALVDVVCLLSFAPQSALDVGNDFPYACYTAITANPLQIVTDPTATPPKSSASTAAIVGVPAPSAVAGGGGTKNNPTTSKLEEESIQVG